MDAPRGLCPQCLRQHVAAAEVVVIGAPAESGAVASRESQMPFSARRVDFGDYKLLGEIARGGMGVVYRARQISLNRVVAVKMILSGQLASEAEVKRFRIEAEAAANLRHPNIVAIHEIGEQNGRHYFSMDFIEGRNLAEYAKAQPLSALEVAQLMSTLADAVHYAHQRGTLHRDLKPQNVLIDAKGQPHITDFGLAKRWNVLAESPAPSTKPDNLDSSDLSSELTTAGSVMGSPAYMGPEQAAGRIDEIAPATDVYSLGAILYRLLTGRPPHRGATPKETLAKVINEEPTPPRRLKIDVPEELETICLKCLEKQPGRRYATARALAEDLNRFVSGEPILAHPASPIRKAWSWTLRNPWVLVTSASVLLIGAVGAAFSSREMMRFERREALLLRAEHAALSMPASAKQRAVQYAEGMGYLQQALAIHEDGDVTRPAMNLLARSGKAWRRIEHSYGGNPAAIRRIISCADGRYLVVLTRQGECEIFDARARKSVFKVAAAGLANPLLAASPDGTWIALADKGRSPGEVRLWHWTVSPDPVVLQAGAGGVDVMGFSPVGLRLATAGVATAESGGEPEIHFWDVRRTRLVQTIPCFTNPFYRRKTANKIERLVFDPTGTLLEARNGDNDFQYLQLTSQWNLLDGAAAKEAAQKFRANNVFLRPWGVLQADGPNKNQVVAIRAFGWDLCWRGVAPVFSKDRRLLAANFLVLDLQAPTEPLFFSEKVVSAINAIRGENLRAPASVAWQPVHLPARVVAMGPAGSWITFDPAGSAFLFWRTVDVLEEWKRFELRDAMVAGSDRPAQGQRRPAQSAPSIESQFHAEIFAGLFLVASFLCLFATSGIGALAVWRKHLGLGPSRASPVLAAALGTGAVALGLGATVRLVFVKVWDYPDSVPLLVVAACYFVGWGVAMAIDAARSYHALLLGRSGSDFRSTRFFYAALLIVIIAAVGKAIGHRSSELSSLLSAGIGAGILAGFIVALLSDLNSRVWAVRVLVSQAIAAVLAWLCGPDDLNAALMFACPLFLGFVVGVDLAGRVPTRVRDWNVTAGEQVLAWLARRRKKLEAKSVGSLPAP